MRSFEFPGELRGYPSSSFHSAATTERYRIIRCDVALIAYFVRSTAWQPGQHIPLSVPESSSHSLDGPSVVQGVANLAILYRRPIYKNHDYSGGHFREVMCFREQTERH